MSLLGIGDGSASSVNELIQSASTPPSAIHSGGFRKILGSVVGGAANVLMPGIGSVISNVIGGGGVNSVLDGNMTPGAMLQMQQQMAQEQEAFTLASTIIKDRHDAAMDAIRNSKSS